MSAPAANAQIVQVYRGEQPVIPFAPPATASVASKELVIYLSIGLGSAVLFTFTESDGIAIVDAAAGTFTWTITRARLLTLTRENYSWELWDLTANERLAGGTLIVIQSSRPIA